MHNPRHLIPLLVLLSLGCTEQPSSQTKKLQRGDFGHLGVYRDEARKVTCYTSRLEAIFCVVDPTPCSKEPKE